MSEQPKRIVVIANTQPGLTEVIATIATAFPDAIVDQFPELKEGFRSVRDTGPQILLIDLNLLAKHKTDALDRFRAAQPSISIIGLVTNGGQAVSYREMHKPDECILTGSGSGPVLTVAIRHAFVRSNLIKKSLRNQRRLREAKKRIEVLQNGRNPADDVATESTKGQLIEVNARLGQAQKMEALGQLTGGLAHDFNNLLAVIIGNLQLIQRSLSKTGDERLSKQANAALEAATRGAKLTRQMLTVARRQPLEPQAITMPELLGEFTEILYRTLGGAIKVDIRVAPDSWAVMADPSLLESAVLNLSINARDAMPDGGILLIEVRNIAIDEQNKSDYPELGTGDYVSLSVSDDGAGIPAAILARVTEPFFTTKKPGSGTGLGLSMVHGFAAQSGGHFELLSKEAHGTTATIYLPRATDSDIEQTTATQTALRAIPNGHEDILLVEDDSTVRDVARSMLEALGYTIHEATDADDALDVLRNGRNFDLVITDVVMPGSMNGIELGRQVRQLRPAIKVLHTSGYIGGSGNNGDEILVQPFLGKPYKFDVLAAKVREVLDA